MTVHENQKTKKWYYQFMLNGERKHGLCVGATSEKEAQKIETAIKYKLMQQQSGILPREEKSIPLKKLVDLFANYSQINKKSWRTDESRAKIILKFFGANTNILMIKPADIENFKKYLLYDMSRSKPTVNRYLEQMRTMLNMALSNKYIKENPMLWVKKFPCENYTIRYLTKEEEAELFKCLPEYLKLIVTVALHTGLRKRNILDLQWEQINFDFKFIEVLKNKGNKRIQIPLSDTLYQEFSELRKDKGYVFINPETGLQYQDIKKSFNAAMAKAGIENFRFHDLRHTVATRLVERGIDLVVVKDILAHSDIKTTMRYAHPVPQRKLEAIQVLNSY